MIFRKWKRKKITSDTPGRRQLFEKGTLQHSISVTSQGTPSGITAASVNGDFLALGQNL